LAAILYYFGRIISDAKPEKSDNHMPYFEGFFFSSIYLFLPVIFSIIFLEWLDFRTSFAIILTLVCYPVYVSTSKLKIGNIFVASALIANLILLVIFYAVFVIVLNLNFFLWLLLLQFLSVQYTSAVSQAFQYSRFVPETEFKKQMRRASSGADKLTIFGLPQIFVAKLNTLFIYDFPGVIAKSILLLFLLSLLNFASTSYIFTHNSGDLLVLSLSLLFTAFSLSLIAAMYGYSRAVYQSSNVSLDDGSTIKGKLMKYSDDYIYLVKNNKKIFINRDRIKKIEQSLHLKIKRRAL
jgi:hypothetical protein